MKGARSRCGHWRRPSQPAAPAKAAEAAAPAPAVVDDPDDLTNLAGIGPKAAKALTASLQGLIGQLSRHRNPFIVDLGREAGLMLGECYERMGEPDAAYESYREHV